MNNDIPDKRSLMAVERRDQSVVVANPLVTRGIADLAKPVEKQISLDDEVMRKLPALAALMQSAKDLRAMLSPLNGPKGTHPFRPVLQASYNHVLLHALSLRHKKQAEAAVESLACTGSDEESGSQRLDEQLDSGADERSGEGCRSCQTGCRTRSLLPGSQGLETPRHQFGWPVGLTN